MKKFVVAFVLAALALVVPVQAQVMPKVRPSAPQSATLRFETIDDALSSVTGRLAPVPTSDRNEVLQVVWGDNPIVFYNGVPMLPWVDWADGQVTITTQEIEGSNLFANGAMIRFSLTSDGRFQVVASDYNGYGGARGTIGGANSSGGVSIDSESVCRCFGGDTNTVRRTCTTTECDTAGTNCETSGLAAYCSWRATRASQ